MTVPGNVSAKKLAGDYLADLTQVALRYLPKGDRMKFVGRTKAMIERRCGPLADAEPDQVAALLAELGTPRELVMKERERLDQAWARRRSAARGTGASQAAPWEQRPITSRWRPATGDRMRPPRAGRLLRGGRGKQDEPGATGLAGDQDAAAAPDAVPAHAPPRWPGGVSAAGRPAGPAAAADTGAVEAAAAEAGTAGSGTGAGTVAPGTEPGTTAPGTEAGTTAPGTEAGTTAPGTEAGTAASGTEAGATAPGTGAGTAASGTEGAAEAGAAGPVTSGAAAGEWTPPVPAEEWTGSGMGGQDAARDAAGGERAAAGLAEDPGGTRADVAGPAARDPAEPAPAPQDAAGRDPARQDPGGELVPWLAAIDPTSVVRPPLPPVPASSVAPGPPTIPGLTLADDAGSELVPARGPAGTLVPLTPAGLASMARGHRREALAVILLGVGGLLLPLPCWPLGAAVAGFSRFWEARYRWVSLYGPVLVTLILTVPLAAIAGGHGNAVSIYLHTIWLDARYLIRIGCVLTAAYLTWLVRRGPRERIPPWRR